MLWVNASTEAAVVEVGLASSPVARAPWMASPAWASPLLLGTPTSKVEIPVRHPVAIRSGVGHQAVDLVGWIPFPLPVAMFLVEGFCGYVPNTTPSVVSPISGVIDALTSTFTETSGAGAMLWFSLVLNSRAVEVKGARAGRMSVPLPLPLPSKALTTHTAPGPGLRPEPENHELRLALALELALTFALQLGLQRILILITGILRHNVSPRDVRDTA